MFLVDELTEQLLCSTCSKYLNVKPIKVYPNGVVKCGRCCKNDEGTISLYNHLLDHSVFRCINRFEGCRSFLIQSEVLDHEEKCYTGNYICPLCPRDSLQGSSAYYFVLHFKTCHLKNIIDKPQKYVRMGVESKDYFLFQQADLIYLLYIHFDNNNKHLKANVSSLGPRERSANIKQQVQILNTSQECLYTTPWQNCSLFADNSDPFTIPVTEMEDLSLFIILFSLNTCNIDKLFLLPALKPSPYRRDENEIVGLHNRYPRIYLSEEFKQKYPEYYLSTCQTKLLKMVNNVDEVFPRICCFCENTFIHSSEYNIFKCGRDHYYCATCYNYEPYCRKSHIDKLFCTTTETMVYTLLYFYCKWNCSRFYCGNDLVFHEKNCRNVVHSKFIPNIVPKISNTFFSEDIDFKESPAIHVITRDDFEFCLYTRYDNGKISIWIRHKYDLNRFYILFRIKDKFSTMETLKANSFQLNSTKEPFYFAVLIRRCEYTDDE